MTEAIKNNCFDFKKNFGALCKVKDFSNERPKCFFIKDFTFNLNDNHVEIIKSCATLRSNLNKYTKGLAGIHEFERGEQKEADIDLKSLTSEYALTTLLFHASKFLKSYKVSAPAIAQIILSQEPDFYMEDLQTGKKVCFDLKSAWDNQRSMTVSKKSHEKYKGVSDFYMICLTSRDAFGMPKECKFYAMTNKFFEDNARLVHGPRNDFYSIDIEKIFN